MKIQQAPLKTIGSTLPSKSNFGGGFDGAGELHIGLLNPIPLTGRIPSLDGWRAIAIFLVLGDHMPYSSHFPYSEYNWLPKVFHGDLGVRIFFVLSGFLITFLLIGEADGKGKVDLWKFYVRRVLRIFPVYFTYLGVLGVLFLIGLYKDSLSSWIGALTFTRNMVGQGKSATVHFWSLAVEEQFYFVWPMAFSYLSLWRRRIPYVSILWFFIIICPILRAFFMAENPGGDIVNRLFGVRSILMYADSLAVGCLGAFYARRVSTGGEWKPYHNFFLLIALGGIVAGRCAQFLLPSSMQGIVNAISPSLQAWSIMVALWLSIHPCSFVYKFLNLKPIVWIGCLSYSIYIWHVIFLSHFMGDQYVGWITHNWMIWIFPSVVFAAISYYGLEMPLVALRKSFRA